jgi:hypothetical protein
LSDPARPGLKIAARVTRTSGEIDLKTWTLLAEIDLANPHSRVLPGSFVQVQLQVRTPRYVEVPSDALIVHVSQLATTTQSQLVEVRYARLRWAACRWPREEGPQH